LKRNYIWGYANEKGKIPLNLNIPFRRAQKQYGGLFKVGSKGFVSVSVSHGDYKGDSFTHTGGPRGVEALTPVVMAVAFFRDIAPSIPNSAGFLLG
jgi:hypothetical protein